LTETFQEVLQIVFEQLGAEEAEKLQKALTAVGTAGADTDARLAPLVKQLEELQSTSGKVAQAIDISKKIEANNSALAEAKKALSDLNAEFDRTDKTSADVSIAFSQAEKRVKTLSAEQLKLQSAFAASTSTLRQSGINTTNLVSAQDELRAKTAAVAQQITTAASGIKNLGSESAKTQGLLGTLKDHLLEIASVATAVGVALKTIDFGKQAFGEASDIEASLARVQALAQGSAHDFGALAEQIERSATAANASGVESASAAAALAEQGQSAAEIYEALTPTLLLAKNASIDLGQAAGIVDDTLDLFGKTAAYAGLAVDQLTAASKGSKDGLNGLADGVRTLAPDARALGLTFEDLVGLLGFMSQNGIDASKSARGLRTVFQDLQDPASKLSLALASLGDTSGNFSSAIETLRSAGGRGKDALLGLDGAARSLVEFLLQQGPNAVATFTASLANAQGTAAATAQTLDNTLKGSFTSFENALERVRSGLVKTSLAPLREELQKLSGQLVAFAESPAFAQLQQQLGDLFKEGTEAFDTFIQHVDWPKFVEGARGALKDASDSIHEFKDDLSAVAGAIGKVGDAIGVVYRAIAVAFDLAKVATNELVAHIAGSQLQYTRALDALTGKTSGATIALESLRDAAKSASSQGVDALIENSDKLVDNLKSLGGVSDEAAKNVDRVRATFENVRAGVATSSAAIGQAGSDFNVLTRGTENAANALGILPEIFNRDAIAAKAASDAHTEHANQIIRARQAVNDAQAAFDRLTQSGNKDVIAFQEAAKALQDAQAELDRLTGKADQAADSQRALASAFAQLHIVSQDQLEKTAGDAKSSLDTIEQAFQNNKATIEDVKRAYAAYAAAVKASVADSSDAVKQHAQAELDAKAAALGLAQSVAQAGAAGKEAGDQTADAFDNAAEKIKSASDAAGDLAANATEAAAGVQDVASSATAATSSLSQATQGIVLLSNEQLRGLREVAEELRAGGLSLEQYEQRIQEVMTGTSRAIEEQQELLKKSRSLQQDLLLQLAQQDGDDVEQENIRHQQALDNLREELTVDGQLNTIEFAKVEALENKRHENALRNIRAEADARKDAASDTSTTSAVGGGIGVNANRGNSGVPAGGVLGTFKIDFGNGNVVSVTGNQQTGKDLQRFLDELRRRAMASGLGSRLSR
jgi:TP901 family phage tail tape measure protein